MKRIPWWLATWLGVACVIASFPVDKLPGIALAVVGASLVWIGYGKRRRDLEEGEK